MFGSYPHPPNLYERNYIEFIAVFVKPGKPRTLPKRVKEASKITSDEWMDLTRQIWWMYPENVPRLEGHPAPFPEALPNRLIAMYSFAAVPEEGFAGDIILDPLAGRERRALRPNASAAVLSGSISMRNSAVMRPTELPVCRSPHVS
ncbi:MAG: site-specific DNA-methyltransferase [Deltaproteobacteria bacterium]|nr:site-specific DNA-methyltransferase [Deltaproteobacteria bacterium]